MLNLIAIVFEQMMLYLPLVLGSYISFSLLKVPDLSLETSYLIGAFCGSLALHATQGYAVQFSLCIVLLASIIGGMLVGLTASCMTRFGKIPHLLSSIITFGLFQGLFLMLSPSYVSLARYKNVVMFMPYLSKHPELFTLVIINCCIVACCGYLFRTQLGYAFAIFGHNPLFFHHFKISADYVFIMGIVIAHGLAGLSGFLFAQSNNLLDMNMGVGKALFCITALILGRAVVPQVKISCLVPLVGVCIYFTLQQVLLKIGFNLQYFTMVQSILVLGVVLTMYRNQVSQYDQVGI